MPASSGELAGSCDRRTLGAATSGYERSNRRGSHDARRRERLGAREFEQVYRANVGAVTAYFARHCADPQTVADLTSETIVRAAGAFGGFDPGRGSARAWLFGIAGHVSARYCAQASNGRDATARLAGLAVLPVDEIDAAALGVPRGVPRMRLSRARTRLRKGASQR